MSWLICPNHSFDTDSLSPSPGGGGLWEKNVNQMNKWDKRDSEIKSLISFLRLCRYTDSMDIQTVQIIQIVQIAQKNSKNDYDLDINFKFLIPVIFPVIFQKSSAKHTGENFHFENPQLISFCENPPYSMFFFYFVPVKIQRS